MQTEARQRHELGVAVANGARLTENCRAAEEKVCAKGSPGIVYGVPRWLESVHSFGVAKPGQ